MKKILVICQYYYPENFQVTPICEQLVQDGYDVTVLTGLPNYPTGVVPKEYRKGRREEIVNGVKVMRVYEIGRKKGPLFLALNYISFLISSCTKIKKLSKDFDLIFVYQLSPVLMGIPGLKYAKKNRKPLFLYCCDLWPESLKMYIKNERNPIYKFVKRISRDIYRNCNLIAVQSTSFIQYMKDEHNISPDKLVYLPAFADETYLNIPIKKREDNVNFIFLGNLGIAQNLLKVLEAINKIKDIPNFTVHFVGDGACYILMQEFVEKNNLSDKVKFYGRRPVLEMIDFYNIADACLVSLKADNKTGLTLPSKVQGYMAAGKPIFGMIDGSAMEVINESKCGVCVKSDDVDSYAECLKSFIQDFNNYSDCGINGRLYFEKNFRKNVCMKNLEQVINSLL